MAGVSKVGPLARILYSGFESDLAYLVQFWESLQGREYVFQLLNCVGRLFRQREAFVRAIMALQHSRNVTTTLTCNFEMARPTNGQERLILT